jgi:ATP-binding cassette subfamily B protein RaxB
MSDSSAWRRIAAHFGQRVLPVLQTEAAECGLACLAMISSYHGHQVDLAGVRGSFHVSLKGTTLVDLTRIATAMNFSARALRLEIDQLRRLNTPCILHWNLNHFVVLVKASSRAVVINDPAIGRVCMSWQEASRHFSGVALELRPMPNFTRQDSRRRVRLKELMGGVVGLPNAVLQMVGLALALEVVALFSPLFIQWTVDHAIPASDAGLLQTIAAGFLLLGFIHVVISFARGWTVMHLAMGLNVQWLANVFAHLIRLPISYFEKRHLGDVTSRFASVDTIQRTLTSTFVEVTLDGLTAGVVLTMMLYYNPPLSLVTLAAVALYALSRKAIYQRAQALTEQQITCAAKQQSTLLESIRGIQSIKLFSGENSRHARWTNLLVATSNRALQAQRLGLISRTTSALVFATENVVIVYLGASAVIERSMTLGMLFAFIAFRTAFTTRVGAFIDRCFDLLMLRVQVARLADIVFTSREDTSSGTLSQPTDQAAKIEVRNLEFRYAAGERLVIDGLSFTIEPGESVAIAGASGCGKTTLVKLMLGLLTPTSGDVLIDGVSIFSLSPGAYRRWVAAVMQDDQLFAGTIEENLTFFDPVPDQPSIRVCAEAAAIHEDIQRMPMKYSTLVGDMGGSLSGGQKQRLLLARALYKRPRVLFLDEATSHLDVGNERYVNESVRRLALTRIIIAHRSETLAMADRVIHLGTRDTTSSIADSPNLVAAS